MNNGEDSKVDGYGFERPEEFDEKSYEEFMSTYLMVLARRAARWRPLVVGQEKVPKSGKVKRFCRKGIPGEHRPLVWMEVWMEVSGAGDRMRAEPGLYKRLLTQKLDETIKDSIMLDLSRTFPENIYFTNIQDPAGLQKPLRNVLTAFAVHSPHIAYCQGLNFVVGIMLLIVRSEEKAFWLLDTLTKHLIPDYYASDMLAVKAEQELMGDLIKWKLPGLYDHLNELGMMWSLVGMKWFICLFADVLPVETVLRIWDCMFYEGSKVLLRVALTLVKRNQQKLMEANNLSKALDTFKAIVTQPGVISCHSFMESIFKETGSMPGARLQSMREECRRRALEDS
ncbi:hypothetical protein ACOMHN_060158 [Nucella lapillus]